MGMVHGVIPGTPLWAYTYYTLSPKAFPEGFITWTAKTNQYNAHYLQVDRNPGSLSNYKKGGKWFADAQWAFFPSEIPGWYTLVNRGLYQRDGRLLSFAWEETDCGHFVIAPQNKKDIDELKFDGPYRNSALWRPVATGEPGFYKLEMKHFPNGVFTWTQQKYGNYSHFMQIDIKSDPSFYQKGGKWWDNALIKFNQAEINTDNITLTARLSSFEFLDVPSSLLESKKKSDNESSSIFKDTLINNSSGTVEREIEETFTKTNTFSFGFEESLKVFASVEAEVNFPFVGGSKVTAGFETSLTANQQITKETTREYRVMQKVTLQPYSSVVVSIFSEWIEDLEIPFTANMHIVGEIKEADGKSRPVPSEHILMKLEDSKFGKVQIVKESENALEINVKGKFKGTFGFKGVASVEEISKKERIK